MKGIILAGGSGTRLYPTTEVVSKQLMPIYNKPMIYYPLCTLMTSGIQDILIISTPQDLPLFEKLLGNGSRWGISLSYVVQEHPNGLAEAFILGKKFINNSPSCLILGDNIFHGSHLEDKLRAVVRRYQANDAFGAHIFAYKVSDPERYGVISFDDKGSPEKIVEKPRNPVSSYAVTGLYFYDEQVCQLAERLTPSARNELEITDLNQHYLDQGKLRVEKLGRGDAWLDTGTFDSMLEASTFIQVLEKRQGVLMGCPEEVAFRMKYIDGKTLSIAGQRYSKNSYGKYIFEIAG